MELTSNDLRYKFKKYGLTYSDINQNRLVKLISLLKLELSKFESFPMKVSLHRRSDFRYNEDGSLICGFIFVDGDYFERREAISFNRDEYVGFAGWASSKNCEPIYRAFDIWIEEIVSDK